MIQNEWFSIGRLRAKQDGLIAIGLIALSVLVRLF
jgi:hypothetical protein